MWYQFGLAVGIAQNVLDSYLEFPPDKCLVEVLNYWLTNHDSQLTWQDVTEALNEMQLYHSVGSTSDEIKTGIRPTVYISLTSMIYVANNIMQVYS